jgi:hypothetical protein
LSRIDPGRAIDTVYGRPAITDKYIQYSRIDPGRDIDTVYGSPAITDKYI